MKNKNIYKIILGLVIILIFAIFISLNTFLKVEGNDLVVSESLITSQNELAKDYSIDNSFENMEIILDPYNNAPLTALALFYTENEEEINVEVVGKDAKTSYNYTFAKSINHYIPILGLYPDTLNKVIISDSKESKVLEIQTAKLPNDLILPDYVYANKDLLSNDLYFYTPSSTGYTCAYDINGDVRWYLSSDSIFALKRLENGHIMISTDSLLQQPYYMTGLYEMDMLGKVYTEFNVSGGYHHDFLELTNGNILVLANNENSEKVEDYIIELDRASGKIVKQIDISKIIDYDEGKNINWTSDDWFHNNALDYDEYSNSILISGRHNDSIISFNYDTLELNWILGSPENWSDKFQKYFLKPIGDDFEYQWGQHDIQVFAKNEISLFDNGNEKAKKLENAVDSDNYYSRGVTYKIDPVEMTVEQTYQYGKERGKNFYSPYISSMEVIGSNHYLVGSLGISFKDGQVVNAPAILEGSDTYLSDTVELLNNEIIFEMKLANNNYRVVKMPLYNQMEYSTSKANVLGSQSTSKVDDIKYGLKPNSIEINDTYTSRNIDIIKKEDRLEISGLFKKDDSIKIILYRNGKSLIYDVMSNDVDSKAACVAVFTNNHQEGLVDVIAHINESGLANKYEIFVEINNQVFKTNLAVNFK